MKKIVFVVIFLISFSLKAQQRGRNSDPTKSIKGIVKEVLNIISGEEGKERNWDAFRNLFLPTARMTVVYHDEDHPIPIETVSVDEFIAHLSDEYYQKGFTEYELGKAVDEYNGIAHVFQSFYAKDSESKEERGINSYQLVYHSERWWIANLVWTGDSNGVKIPKKYLRKR
ncbi:hypothetical protein [Saccharicrinis sp. GN24d3]|uniref:hypothetical protein n=1 Tax=Saccharicrinis sp. GN24d3 TaxID=3458416 RepID=UPI0040367D84